MRAELSLVDSFFQVLVEEIRREAPEYLDSPFTVAEIYQSLVPYRSHRDRIGAEMSGDYEDALLRLLSGEGDYLELESDTARERIRLELRSSNPNTGLFREFAAVGVRLNLSLVPPAEEAPVEKAPVEKSPSEKAANAPAGLQVDGLDGLSDARSPSRSKKSSSKEAGAPGGADTRPSGRASPTAEASSPATEPSPSAPGPSPSNSEPADRPAVAAAEAEGEEAVPDACPECSSQLPRRDSLRFCPFCGINVFVVPCGECGEVLERSWSFCVACGTAAD